MYYDLTAKNRTLVLCCSVVCTTVRAKVYIDVFLYTAVTIVFCMYMRYRALSWYFADAQTKFLFHLPTCSSKMWGFRLPVLGLPPSQWSPTNTFVSARKSGSSSRWSLLTLLTLKAPFGARSVLTQPSCTQQQILLP